MGPECVEEWRDYVPELLEAKGWEVAASVEGSSLAHRPCPWQGHLVRFQLERMEILDPPCAQRVPAGKARDPGGLPDAVPHEGHQHQQSGASVLGLEFFFKFIWKGLGESIKKG